MTVLGSGESLVELRDVKAFTWYCVNILAFTSIGDGQESSCVFVLTGENGKIKCKKSGHPSPLPMAKKFDSNEAA